MRNTVVSSQWSERVKAPKGIFPVFLFLITNHWSLATVITGYWSLTTEVWAEPRITIAAAADLSFALKEIAQRFERERGVKVTLSFGSSGMLARQIENGAPMDVFFSANRGYIERLKERGLIINGSEALYAQGRLVLAVNRSSGIKLDKLEDLLNPSIKRIAIANPDHAPYGVAAKEALVNKGLWNRVKSRLVYGENIRQTLQFIQTGDAPVGIVALSVANVPDITYNMIDSSLYSPINQVVVIVKATRVEKEARDFILYVNGPKGRPIMKWYGFVLPIED